MLTDSPPRKNGAGFSESERIKTLDLPQNGRLPDTAKRLESAMKAFAAPDVGRVAPNFWRPPQISTTFKGAASVYLPRDRCASARITLLNSSATISPRRCSSGYGCERRYSPLASHLEQQNPCRDRRVDRIATSAHRDSNHEIGSLKQLVGEPALLASNR